jgi:hypothetical protein
VAIEGTAIAAGTPARSVTIPSPWRVRIENGHVIAAEPELHAIARHFVATADPALLEDVNLAELARVIGFRYRGQPAFRAAGPILLERARAVGNAAAESEMSRNLSMTLPTLNHPQAWQYARQALAIARAARDADAEADALFTMGVQHWHVREPEAAIDWFLQSAALAERVDDPIFAIKAAHMATILEVRRGRYGDAVVLSRRVAALSRRFGWQEGELTAMISEQDVLTELRQHDVAARVGHETYARAQRAGP